MKHATMVTILLLLASAAAVQAQQPRERGVGAEARVQAALDAALEAGIPVVLLERKVAEGRAKGVPMDRIAAAVEARLAALAHARGALERARVQSVSAGDLSIAADAVQAGVSDAALAEIARSAPQHRRAVAVAVLTNLVALGHASERALAQVQAALGRGPEAILNLQARTSAELRARGGGNGVVGVGVGVGAGASTGAGGGAKVDPPGKKGKGGG